MPKGVYDHSKIRGRLKTLEHNEKNRLAHLGVKNPKIGLGQIGEKNSQWKGDNVGYKSLHQWVYRWLSKNPKQCSNCGILGVKNYSKWSIHWANKSGKYLRKTTDWIALCVKCHKEYDKK